MHSEEKKRRHDSLVAEEEAFEASRDYWGEFRHIRDLKLQSCDWTQLSDAPITQEQKSLWEIYRQELRDLPENIVDPKPLVYSYLAGESHPDWPIPPN